MNGYFSDFERFFALSLARANLTFLNADVDEIHGSRESHDQPDQEGASESLPMSL